MPEILALPAYRAAQDLVKPEKLVERDITQLRDSGHNVVTVLNSAGDYEYQLDLSGNMTVAVPKGVATWLVRALASLSKATPDMFAQSGVQKMLSDSEYPEFSGQVAASLFDLRVPSGESVIPVATAIQRRHCIEFDYSPLSGEQARYQVEPWGIEVRGSAFYLRGWLRAKNGVEASGVRTYKLDRVRGKVVELAEQITQTPQRVPSMLTPVDAQVWMRADIPLVERGTVLDTDGDWKLVQLLAVDRSDLFADLVFYGKNIRLAGPVELVAEYRQRLAHIGMLGGES